MRKSSRGRPPVGPVPNPPADLIRAPEFIGFEPTDMQLRTKAKLWAMYDESPLVHPENMRPTDMARMLDSPSLPSWWVDPNFRSWFLQKDGWKYDLEFAFQLWMDDALKRVRTRSLSDKDFLAFGRLLGEMTARTGSAAKRDGDDSKKKELSEAEAIKLIEALAPALGFVRLPATTVAPAKTEDVDGEAHKPG